MLNHKRTIYTIERRRWQIGKYYNSPMVGTWHTLGRFRASSWTAALEKAEAASHAPLSDLRVVRPVIREE